MTNKDIKAEVEELWDLIEKHAPEFSDEYGWGTTQSLCEELLELKTEALKEERSKVVEEIEGISIDLSAIKNRSVVGVVKETHKQILKTLKNI